MSAITSESLGLRVPLAMVLIAMAGAPEVRAAALAAPGQPAPALVARSFAGEALDLATLRGKVVVLNFWASWCEPCRSEMPLLEAISRDYRERGVVVVGLSADDRHDRKDAVAAAGSVGYFTGLLSEAPANGFGSPQALPLTYIIAPTGQVSAVLSANRGALSAAQLRAAVDTALAGAGAAADAGPRANPGAELTVQQILDRHVAARGGIKAWQKIQTMAWTGHIESGPGGISKRPFLLVFRRPAAMRFELLAEGQRTVRIFDGEQGWKLRPTAAGLPEVKDYSAEEISFARDAGDLDGPLIDSQAKGISAALLGVDSVEGHRAFHLRLTLPSGHLHDDWVDAQSFLELRYERETHSATGMRGTVPVYLRNYQTFEGVVIPALIETGEPARADTDKMIIEKVALNPAVDPAQFSRPNVPTRRHGGVLVNTESSPGAAPPGR